MTHPSPYYRPEAGGLIEDAGAFLGDLLGTAATPALEQAISDPAVQAQIEALALGIMQSDAMQASARRYMLEAGILIGGAVFAGLAAYALIFRR